MLVSTMLKSDSNFDPIDNRDTDLSCTNERSITFVFDVDKFYEFVLTPFSEPPYNENCYYYQG